MEIGSFCPRQIAVRQKEKDMKDSLYSRFNKNDLILRDELAIDRTLLANERTLLAYIRSGVAMLITGISIIHFSSANWFIIAGIACIPIGIITCIIGIARYYKMNKSISTVRNLSEKNRIENTK